MTSPQTQTSGWQLGAVEKIVDENYRVKTFTLRLPEWKPFRAGQHYDVRLTAPDGYQAQRSYSIATAPETEGTIDLTIELMDDGEVSPYFHEVVQVGEYEPLHPVTDQQCDLLLPFRVVAGMVRARQPAMRVDILDLADPGYGDPFVLELFEDRWLRRRERVVAPVLCARERARLALVRARDHAPDRISIAELTRDFAGAVQLPERNRLLVRGDLKYTVG